ncbi:MAG: phosphoribosyl-AMP cyclohydrolase [Spirochaetes bacterium]|nr:MAG: phosphoribosyl-AMP cyclohydrolase [Spirochaetota bacterium]
MELPEIDFDKMNGLVPVIAQDAETGQILMLAYADRKAVELTMETGKAHYYSRSRQKIWEKGATSGHIQEIVEIRLDCDNDAILYKVNQKGGACHTGFYSCFYRVMDKNGLHVDGVKVFDPEDIY